MFPTHPLKSYLKVDAMRVIAFFSRLTCALTRDSMLKATQQALIESMRDIMQNNRTINEQIMFQLSVRMSHVLEAWAM